jgi:hypothetical protein
MYCKKCGEEKKNSSELCNNCAKQELNLKKQEHQGKNRKYLGWFVAVLVFIVIAVSSSVSSKQEQEKSLTNAVDNVVFGTDKKTDSDTEKVLSVYLNTITKNNKEEFKYTREVETSTVMEYESFETKAEIKSSIELLDLSINELENYREKIDSSKEKGLQALRDDKGISKELLDGFLVGFNKSDNNPEKEYISERRHRLLKEHNMVLREIYVFLDKNFNKYEVGFDENGEENIFSDDDNFIDGYNALFEKSTVSYNRQLEAYNNLLEYSDSNLQEYGIDSSTEDIVNAYY